MIQAWPSGPGSRPSCEQVISAPRNDCGVTIASCGVRRSSVVAMRAIRPGSMCLGSARAISGRMSLMSRASVEAPSSARLASALRASAVVAMAGQLLLDRGGDGELAVGGGVDDVAAPVDLLPGDVGLALV